MSSIAPSLPRTPAGRWRGWSGQIYTSDVCGIVEAIERGPRDAVGLAVAREGKPARQVLRPTPRITAAWLSRARGAEATEIHAVAVPAAEAGRVVYDLQVAR